MSPEKSSQAYIPFPEAVALLNATDQRIREQFGLERPVAPTTRTRDQCIVGNLRSDLPQSPQILIDSKLQREPHASLTAVKYHTAFPLESSGIAVCSHPKALELSVLHMHGSREENASPLITSETSYFAITACRRIIQGVSQEPTVRLLVGHGKVIEQGGAKHYPPKKEDICNPTSLNQVEEFLGNIANILIDASTDQYGVKNALPHM